MSAAKTSISLSEHFVGFAQRLVSEGRYGSVSEVVREGLRMLEERQKQLEAINRALIDGENSGPAVPFDWDDFYDRMHREVETETRAA